MSTDKAHFSAFLTHQVGGDHFWVLVILIRARNVAYRCINDGYMHGRANIRNSSIEGHGDLSHRDIGIQVLLILFQICLELSSKPRRARNINTCDVHLQDRFDAQHGHT